jgi:hypothetical protein
MNTNENPSAFPMGNELPEMFGKYFIVPNMGLKPSPLGETFRSTTSE